LNFFQLLFRKAWNKSSPAGYQHTCHDWPFIIDYFKRSPPGGKGIVPGSGILFISLILFFMGTTNYAGESGFSLASAQLRNPQDFFIVFAIIFPALQA
jgi:hypothetical protein